jgi:hypothetical protein
MNLRSRVTATVLMACFFTGTCLASSIGSVAGYAKDSTGASLPGVQVVIINTATSAKITKTTGSDGGFQFPQLAPGTYKIEATLAGFKRVNIQQVVVEVDQITRVDLTLPIGQVSDSVEVTSATPLLEADKSSIGSVVESKTIESMPLNARQFLDLAYVTPGVSLASPGVQGGGFDAAGARSQSNVFLLDGVSNIDTQTNQPLTNFRITDAIQEFDVQTSGALAEFGRSSGAQVNIVTKSGTNTIHGSAFEYVRNTIFNADDYFTNLAGATKAPLHRNQFGATLGGPIVRNKTFLFLSYEGFLQTAPVVSTTRVPSASDIATVTDPISKALLAFYPAPNSTTLGGTLNYTANVASSDFDHTGLLRLDQTLTSKDQLTFRWIESRGALVYAGTLPNEGGNSDTPVQRSVLVNETHTFTTSLLNEFRLGYSRNLTARTVQDKNINAATIFTSGGVPLTGVVNSTANPQDAGLPTVTINGGYAGLGTTSSYPQGRTTNTEEIVDNVTKTLSRHTFKVGFHIRREDLKRYADSNSRGALTFNTFAQFAAGQIQTASTRSGSTLAYWRHYPIDAFAQDQFKVSESLTINYGIRYELPSALSNLQDRAANFVPGIGPVVTGTDNVVTINPLLTGYSAVSLIPGTYTLPKSGTFSRKDQVAPVFGFAYAPRSNGGILGNNATVIRGGFRMAYDDLFNNVPSNMALAPPFTLPTTQTAAVTQPTTFSYAVAFNQNVPLVSNYGKQGPGTPTSGTIALTNVDPNLKNAYVYQYNFGIQREIAKNLSLEADYEGSSSHALPIFLDLNQPTVVVNNPNVSFKTSPNQQIFPYPYFGKLEQLRSLSSGNYNGLTATAKFQGNRGYFLQASYTYSKSLDDNSSIYGSNGSLGEAGNPADSRNIHAEYGPSAYNVAHRFVGVYVLSLPIGPGHYLLGWNNAINREISGGWQFSGITTLQAGQPFTVEQGGADTNGFNQFDIGNSSQSNARPNIAPSCVNGIGQNNRNHAAAFTKSCFIASTTPGVIGNESRDKYNGPGLDNWDMALVKRFPITTRVNFSLRGDFFNVFNHTNFANPIVYMNNANFGLITQTEGSAVATAVGTTGGPIGGARVLQFSGRVTF